MPNEIPNTPGIDRYKGVEVSKKSKFVMIIIPSRVMNK
jgi:hypothetical protein